MRENRHNGAIVEAFASRFWNEECDNSNSQDIAMPDSIKKAMQEHCALKASDQQLLFDAMNQLGFSACGCVRILKIARTITDLAAEENVGTGHLMEAINYRWFDAGSQLWCFNPR